MPEIPTVVWSAPLLDRSGFAEESRNFILALDEHGIDVKADPLYRNPWQARLTSGAAERIERLIPERVPDRFIQVVHGRPSELIRHPGAEIAVGRTMFETDGSPPAIERCDEMDEIWVPSTFNLESFARAGVERSKLHKIPQALSAHFYTDAVEPMHLSGLESRFLFLSVFVWQLRKGWDVLVRAFLEEFSHGEEVALVMKVGGDPSLTPSIDHARLQLERFMRDELDRDPAGDPPIVLLDLDVVDEDIPRLYGTADAYVMPSRGEGWGRPYMEAMAAGLPTIGTRSTGNLEFMTDDNSYLVDCVPVDVPPEGWSEVPPYRGHRWSEPSVSHLRRTMRRVHDDRTEAAKIGARAREEILTEYGWEPVASQVSDRLAALGMAPIRARPRTSQRISVAWEGAQFVEHSLAVVNRELCRALIGTGRASVSLRTADPPESEHQPAAWAALLDRRETGPGPVDVHVRHAWPLNMDPPPSGRWVMMQPWEWRGVPRVWVDFMNSKVDELWAPSTFVRDSWVDNGVRAEKVSIIPNGVDPVRFHPGVAPLDLETSKSFKFLYVGGTIYRKGPDILLEAYLRAFGPDDDVCLVIKDIGTESFYRRHVMKDQIRAVQEDPTAPEILYIDAEWPYDVMPHLYAACDCLVSPYRAEGFGLPIAEAMACGLPVIVTDHGACLDFCDPSVAELVPAVVVRSPHNRMGDLDTVLPAEWAEVDREELARAMSRVMTDPGAAGRMGQRASRKILTEFTWKSSANRALERLGELSSQEVSSPVPSPSTGRKTLSACLIVRDEAQFIAHCLETLLPVTDQIVVVDTGSTDATIEIAREVGAEVHEFEWIDDFGAARNESLRHATGDWVLVLDGDEHLDPASHNELRRLLQTDDLVGYVVRIQNYTDSVGEASFIEHRLLRLFPNHPELRFRGRDPHAQLQPAGPDLDFRIEPCGVLVHHEGYRPQVLEQKQKLGRNQRALELAVQEEPYEGFHAFNLGMTYALMGRNADAEAELLRSIALSLPETGSHPEYLVNAYLSLAVATYHQERFAEAVAYSSRALALAPDFADAHLTQGAALTRLGHLDVAYAAYQAALASRQPQGPAATDSAAATWKPLLGMAGIEMQRGRWDLATEHLQHAHKLAPDNPSIAVEVARASLAVGNVDAAERIVDLVAAREDAPPETWAVRAEIELAQGRTDAAEAALRQGILEHPGARADYEAGITEISRPDRSTDS